MGTRNLTCVVKDKQYKVAQYCQWDGYPGGQGQIILDFLLAQIQKDDLAKFRKQIDKVTTITTEQLQEYWKKVGANDTGWVSCDISDEFKKQYPQFHRDTGALILKYILDTKKPEVSLETEFMKDPLSCEWCYVINLDRKVLEVYRNGKQKYVEFYFKRLNKKTMSNLEKRLKEK